MTSVRCPSCMAFNIETVDGVQRCKECQRDIMEDVYAINYLLRSYFSEKNPMVVPDSIYQKLRSMQGVEMKLVKKNMMLRRQSL